jgi:hypothetical protein
MWLQAPRYFSRPSLGLTINRIWVETPAIGSGGLVESSTLRFSASLAE